MISLGIYEKALPRDISWEKRLELAKELGFNFVELSIDESDKRLARLDWSEEKIAQINAAIKKTGIPLYTLMLSGHRRYPLGSLDQKTRQKALEMLKKAVILAEKLGIRNIQMAGYDVFYEEKTALTREYFIEDLHKCVQFAAAHQVTLAIETMDDPFINTLADVAQLKKQIKSPWLQAYPDLGNLSAWSNEVAKDLEDHVELIAAIHLKDTLPVTKTTPGKFKNVDFGKGCVDFKGLLKTLQRLGYEGTYTIELWSQETANDPCQETARAKAFFDQIFAELEIKQRPVAG